MLAGLLNFLHTLYCFRNLLSVIVFTIGIILIIIWKFKVKKAPLLVCSVILMVGSCAVISISCYNTYIRPTSADVKLSRQELMDFSEYVLENERFLNVQGFLPNNEKSFYYEEYIEDKNKNGQPIEYNYTNQGVFYRPSCGIYYMLSEYEDEQSAQEAFRENCSLDDNLAIEKYTLIENDSYSDYSLYAKQRHKAAFFDLHQGDFNSTDLKIFILYENYIICFYEVAVATTPKLYSLIKNQQLFNSEYTLKTFV